MSTVHTAVETQADTLDRLEFWSEDRQYGLVVDAENVREVLRVCQRAGRNETGGIMLGVYERTTSEKLDCARVTSMSGPPKDSRAGPTWFVRGVRGLQRILDAHWRRRSAFYIGEWHFHPFAAPIPSDCDVRSLQGIADSHQYQCPEPLVLIIGGDPAGRWVASAYVYLASRGLVALRAEGQAAIAERERRPTTRPEPRR